MFNFFKKKEKLNLSEDTKSDFDNRDNKTDFEEKRKPKKPRNLWVFGLSNMVRVTGLESVFVSETF